MVEMFASVLGLLKRLREGNPFCQLVFLKIYEESMNLAVPVIRNYCRYAIIFNIADVDYGKLVYQETFCPVRFNHRTVPLLILPQNSFVFLYILGVN